MGSGNPNIGAARLFMKSLANIETPRNMGPPQPIDKGQTQIFNSRKRNAGLRDYDPNTEAAEVLMDSIMDIDLPQPVDGNPITAQTQTLGACNVLSYKYPNDLSQQHMQFGHPTGFGKGEEFTQMMVTGLVRNSSLKQQNRRLYRSNPENDITGVDTSSNFLRGLQYQRHAYRGGSGTQFQDSDVQHRKSSVFSHLGPNPQRINHLSNSNSNRFIQQSSPHTAVVNCKPNYNEAVVVRADIGPDPGPSPTMAVGDRMEVDPASTFWDYKRRRGSSEVGVGGDKKKRRRLIRPSLQLEDENSGLQVLKGPIGELFRDDNQTQVSFSSVEMKEPLFKSEICLEKLQEKRAVPVPNPDDFIDEIIQEITDEMTEEIMDEIINMSVLEAEIGPLHMSTNPLCRNHPSFALDRRFPRGVMELWRITF